MGVPASFDREVRDDLRALLESARRRLKLADEWDGDAWQPAATSPAADAVLLTELPFSMSPILAEGLDLALTMARSFLTEAADGLVVAGQLQTLDAGRRIASFGPVVRTSAEKSAAVYWMFDTDKPDQRLARAVLLDCDGLEWQVRYLQRSGQDDLVEQLRHEHGLLIRSASQALGRRAVKTGSGNRVVRVANETLPTKTEMFEKALSRENTGRAAYNELSVYAHPTGHRQSGASDMSGVSGLR